jgi:hypothetical protein
MQEIRGGRPERSADGGPRAGEPPLEGEVLGPGIRSGAPGPFPAPGGASAARPVHHDGLWLGALLIAVGAVLLAGSAGLLAWWDWAVMWPVLVIGLGLLLLARRLS